MKKYTNINVFYIAVLCLLSLGLFPQKTYAQDDKNSVSISIGYTKIMGVNSYFDIKATSRIDKQTLPVKNIEITIINDSNGKNNTLGKVITNGDGRAKFELNDFNSLLIDADNYYNFTFQFAGNDAYEEASENILFKDANIVAKLISEDDVNSISATLVDSKSNEPIADTDLKVQVQRLFRPQTIGEEFNTTDEDGTINVEIEKGIPGIDGKLNFEVVLKESDDYGTVKAIVETNIGVPIVDKSTFDSRELWGSRAKAPLILLISLNIMLFGVWGSLVYLSYNLIRINKS